MKQAISMVAVVCLLLSAGCSASKPAVTVDAVSGRGDGNVLAGDTATRAGDVAAPDRHVADSDVMLDTMDETPKLDVQASPKDLDAGEICLPECAGKACGADGCGGTCGSCAVPLSCIEGTCVGCGDGTCGEGEDQCNCPLECASGCEGCCSDSTCMDGTTVEHCGKKGAACVACQDGKSCLEQSCSHVCGDGICQHDGGESCANCFADCGCDATREACETVATGGWVCMSKSVEVPAGTFWMGCNNCPGTAVQDLECRWDVHPYHEVYLDAYKIAKTLATAQQYASCVAAGGCTIPETGDLATWLDPEKTDHPANYVTWKQAREYCQWLGKDLCTEAQWEKGARGGCEYNGGPAECKAHSRKFPWGNEPYTCELVGGWVCDSWGTEPVCAHSPAGDSPYGLCDMAGNAQDWVLDYYYDQYYCAVPDPGADPGCGQCGEWPGYPEPWSNPPGPNSGVKRVVRGSSYGSSGNLWAVSFREGKDLDSPGVAWIGVRCCSAE